MQNDPRYPEPTAPDLGAQCLRAITQDHRFSDMVRRQAQRLIETLPQPAIRKVAPTGRVSFLY